MSLPSGFLVVGRDKWATLSRVSAVESLPHGEHLTAVTIARRYRGFDGEPWPVEHDVPPELESGLAQPAQLDRVLSYYGRAQSMCSCDLIYIERSRQHASGSVGRFPLLGFDFGYYESETNYYSSLFHECIFGNYSELSGFAGFLNEWLLFPSQDIARAFASVRLTLLKQGADLEHDEPVQPMLIYGLPRQQAGDAE